MAEKLTPEGPTPEQKLGLDHDLRTPAHPRADRELSLRGILGFGAGVLILAVAAALVCTALLGALTSRLKRQDPPPSPLAEASVPVLPPEPRLQRSPPADMARFRAHELAFLGSYGWVDRKAGIARIPVERAIELTVDGGLSPALTDAPPASSPDGGAP